MGTLTLTYQGRRYALEEPTEPLLTRDSRERMESRAVLDVRRGVLEAVLYWFFFCIVIVGHHGPFMGTKTTLRVSAFPVSGLGDVWGWEHSPVSNGNPTTRPETPATVPARKSRVGSSSTASVRRRASVESQRTIK